MPYYVYKILPPSLLTHMETHDRYKDARALVRRLRQEQSSQERPSEAGPQYRMVFAEHQSDAEKLLSKPKDERVIGED